MAYTISNTLNQANNNMNKSNLYGFIGSTLSCIILFLIMWFYIMPYNTAIAESATEEEGLMISFGDNTEGGGQGEDIMGTPNGNSFTPSENIPAISKTTTSTTNQDYLTQNDNSEAISIQNQKNKERQEQITIQNQRIESERQASEQRQKEQAAINKANSSMNGLFGNSTTAGTGTGTGTGSGTGSGHQGNPAGQGFSGGNSWSLNGRALTGTLASPSYDKDIEGKVTVNIRVDESGKVTSATIGSPTTISDTDMRNAAISAAKRTHFSSGRGTAAGSVTYNFRLK